ncbi:InlB B-repeat-containing protein [Formosa maritima]|uniref:T9SS type A sorting domain-containing protein n=1 Tax=Formosa maritima TaxID=2592046 RepID=A0A5D0GME3_9FLAO|nr:InlB B-repeat-containing protein [Formosa maritima]TYA60215.1 T9SS type A sorting domain-containing protein [Formosa maritima]
MIKKYSLALAAFLCFVLSGFGQIVNGDFETWSGSTPTGWTTIDSGITTSEETTIVHGGSSSASINVTTIDHGNTDLRQTVTLINGHVYTVSVWVRHTEGNMRARFFYNGGYGNYSTNSNTTSWQEITTTFTATSTSEEFGLRFYDQSGFDGAEIVYVDDYTITDNSVPAGPTVTYNGNGNTGGSVPIDTNNPYTSGDTVTVLGNIGSLTNTCSTFNNWNTATDGSGTGYSSGNTFTITASTTLYAQWISTANTVTFNNNGGTGTMSPQMDCIAANLTSNTFTNAGFTFNSWNTAANGSGTTYADGASYNFSTDITLYAQWDVYVGPCLATGFEDADSWSNQSGAASWTNTTPDGDYDSDGCYASTGSANSGSRKIGFNDVGDWLELPSTSNPMSLSFWARLSGGSGSQIKVQYDNAGTWTDVPITAQTVTGTSYAQYTFDLSSISSFSNVDMRLYMVTENNSIYLDDLEVYCGTPCTPPTDPSGTISSIDAPDFCETAELAFSGSAPTDIVYYWQTDANGIDTTYDAANTLDVTIDGDFYVRAYNTLTSCWSSGVVGPYTVTISNLPEITDQPDNINVANGGTATFSATITGAVSYQWQVSTNDGATWTNTGTNATTLTVLGVNISMHGYIYRIVATNSCGNTLSDEAVLFVHSGSPCVEEDFVGFPNTGWSNSGTIAETTGVHAGASEPCRVFGTNDAITTPQTDYPTILEFYQDASNSGDGNTATVDYRIGAGAWLPLHSFSVTEAGKTELVDLTDVSGVNLASQANVRFRFNSTFNSWYLDDVKVYCTPCTPPTITTTIDLSSGPIGTYVTISGSQLGTATVSINSITLTPISQNANEIIIQIPNNAVDGSIIIETNSLVCDTAFPFDVIDQELSCQTNITPPPTDLFIYELFDEDQNIDGSGGAWGNGGMITIFNGTLETKDLSEYRFYRSTDYTDTASFPYSLWHSPSGTLAPGEVYRIWIDGSNCTDYPTPYETALIGFNANDGVELRKNNGSGSYITIDQLHTANLVGYRYLRDLSATNKPVATYNAADWAFTDIYPSSPYCVGAGQAPNFESGTPSISLSVPTTTCSTFEITASATEGYTGIYGTDSYNLTFQWYYYDGINDVWNSISTGGDYTVVNSTTQSTLSIDHILSKTNFQFYCEVSEGSSCYTASEAIKIELNTSTWTSGAWDNGAPDEYTIAVIDGLYDTTLNGNIDACQLIINSGVNRTLNVTDSHYVRVVNNVVNNGTITVQTHGAFVQDGVGANAGTFTNNGTGTANVTKQTSNFFDDGYNYHYTYWSSPVVNADITAVFPNPRGNRRFYFETANYLDQHTDGTTNGVPDDIDDNGNDWQIATGSMEAGRGYAITATSPPGFPYNNTNLFTGDFNTGDITKSIVINGYFGDNDWNLIGNPYPSAIDFNLLFNFGSNNTIIDGAAFLWSQSAPPEDINPGNEVLNFNQNDYAVISAGSGNIAGGAIGTPPNDFIPSGQGFFVKGLSTNSITFNNDMRMRDGTSNDVFYRTNNDTETLGDQANRLWVNLTSDNGVFSQLLIAYVDGATNSKDSWSYDVPRNMSTGLYSTFYSLIENEDGKFAIQGKFPESLTLDEIISIGFNTTITVPTLYKFSIAQLEGEFMNENTIYLKDKLLNVIHDLSASDYTFTSEIGEFNERFEIVFRDSFLSINEEALSVTNLTIIELQNGEVQFKVPSQYEIKTVELIDLLGRTIYKLNGQSSIETYNLSNLSQATYVAKVTLANGQVLTKKVVKRK